MTAFTDYDQILLFAMLAVMQVFLVLHDKRVGDNTALMDSSSRVCLAPGACCADLVVSFARH